MLSRRTFVAAAGAAGASLATPAFGQHGGDSPYSHLKDPNIKSPPAAVLAAQQVFDSPAPKAENPGRWIARARLPLPRSEMAWATVRNGRMHVIGGYGEQRVNQPYHHIYDPAANRWEPGPPLPRGANHVGVATVGGKLYAIGGFVEQNRKPD
jgi:hypothetical protein